MAEVVGTYFLKRFSFADAGYSSNNDTKEIEFPECKWKDLGETEALRLIEELEEKAISNQLH